MGRKQLVAVYAVVVFMMVWGLDLLNSIKWGKTIALTDAFNPFSFTQVIYTVCMLTATRTVLNRYYPRKSYARLAIGVLLLLAGFIMLRYVLEEVFLPLLFHLRNYPKSVRLLFYSLDNLYYALLYGVLGFLIFLLDYQVTTQKAQARLLQQNREAELQVLRSQINPHFLFNTLNNIYALVYEASAKAPEAVLRLADLMRYVLYEQKERVPLVHEWRQVQSLIELQRLRFAHPLPVDEKVDGEPEGYLIAPHLLLPFVENAFKHSDLNNPDHPLIIHLCCSENKLTFFTQNKIGNGQKDERGGVGLENVRRRLALLYPAKHQLTINHQNGTWSASLTLTA